MERSMNTDTFKALREAGFDEKQVVMDTNIDHQPDGQDLPAHQVEHWMALPADERLEILDYCRNPIQGPLSGKDLLAFAVGFAWRLDGRSA